MYLWRAVDDEGEVLVQRPRDKAAARKLMRKLLKKHGFSPTQLTTDKLRSYGAAFRQLGLAAHHERKHPVSAAVRQLSSARGLLSSSRAAVHAGGFGGCR